jgi:glyceraldehyde 3-phosphate dehydrogenase
VRVAINGGGRIGRAALKILMDSPGFELVAVNDLIPADHLVYLIRYDSVYGPYRHRVVIEDSTLMIDDHRVKLFSEQDPANLPWRDMNIDLVLECTGMFRKEEDLQKHIVAGAKFVILSAPAKSESIGVVVHGVNQADGTSRIISCASCTTNCIARLVEIMKRRIGIQRAIMTTVHAYTASQQVVDGYDKSFRRGRAAAANMVPTSTGAAEATVRALPELRDRFDGVAIRVPVAIGSIADVTFVTSRATTREEINDIFRQEASGGRYKDVVGVSEDPIVSSDIIGDSRASIVDLEMTRVVDGTLAKVMSWYDNEWVWDSESTSGRNWRPGILVQ